MNNQMETMAKDLKKCLPSGWYWSSSVDSEVNIVAKHFYNIGYRNEKETAKEILQELYNEFSSGLSYSGASEFLRDYAKEKFGIEVK